MIKLCPRCSGRLFFDKEWYCFNCGYRENEVPDYIKEEIRRKKKRKNKNKNEASETGESLP